MSEEDSTSTERKRYLHGTTSSEEVIVSSNLISSIVSLDQEVIDIIGFFNEHFTETELVITVITIQTSLAGNVSEDGVGLSDLHITVNEVWQLTKWKSWLQVWEVEVRDKFQL